MATLDATIGGLKSNSYVTVAAADEHAGSRLQSQSWEDADDDLKTKALLTAVRRIDLLNFTGWRFNWEQALRWPRYGILDRDGWWIKDNTIPKDILIAQIELSIAYLDYQQFRDSEVSPVSNLAAFSDAKVGQIELTIRRDPAKASHAEGRIASWRLAEEKIVEEYLQPYLEQSLHGISLVRG